MGLEGSCRTSCSTQRDWQSANRNTLGIPSWRHLTKKHRRKRKIMLISFLGLASGNFGEHESFLGPLIPLFWTSGDISSGFKSQSGQPYLHLAEAYMLHVSWDSLLVQHLLTSWWLAWQPSHSLLHIFKQALVGLETRTYHATDECSTNRAMPARLLGFR